MFEDSLFESQQRAVSARKPWTAAASMVTQGIILSLLLIIPLLHTESLPERMQQLTVALPIPIRQPPPTVVQRASTQAASTVPMLSHILTAPRTTPSRIDTSLAPDTALSSFKDMNTGLPPGTLLGTNDSPPSRIVVTTAPEKKSGPVRVSAGVSAGLLLTPIRPIYPAIAKAAHVEGTVVVEAIIAKTGAIESLHAVSGPAMLRTAALDAIRAARYQPFQLNGTPTEVQTTITVNFHMGS